MIKYKYCLILIYCFAFKVRAFAQTLNHHLVVFKQESVGVFSFTKKWAYPWNVVKDDKGNFFKDEDGKLTSADTTHLYFTANCKTNVQGGYTVRYCYATKKGADLTLDFSDGLPAYGSSFKVQVENGKFFFKLNIVYPELKFNEKTTQKVTKSKLVLFQKNYKVSKIISGYVDTEFIKTTLLPGHKPYDNNYYFKGYFKTNVKAN